MTRPVFGVDRDPGVMLELAGKPFPGDDKRSKSGTWRRNLMVDAYGPGPEGAKCGSCVSLIRTGASTSGSWFKCLKRGVSSSTATDHRIRWPACAMYEEDE